MRFVEKKLIHMISIDHFNDDFDERLKNFMKPIMLLDGHPTYNPFLIPRAFHMQCQVSILHETSQEY